MDGIDAPKSLTPASHSLPPNSNPSAQLATPPPPTTVNSREEGEVSSSEDDENPVCSVVQPSGASSSAVLPLSLPPSDKDKQDIRAGKAVSGSNIASSVDIHPQNYKQDYQQGFEKNRVSLRPNTLVRHVPAVGSDNLVISFSDDDSGSEEEELRQQKSLESNGNGTGVVKNQKVFAKSIAKSSKSWKRNNNAHKVIPNKLSLNHMSKVSVTKTGGATSRGFGPSSFDQRLQARNSYVLTNRNLANRGRGQEQGDSLNSSKLQDLRQKIAIRENELKMKSAQLNKESNPGPSRDLSNVNQNSVAFRRSSSVSAEPVNVKLKEPEKKRLKVDGSCAIQLSSGDRRETNLEPNTLSSKRKALAHSNALDKKKIDGAQQGMSNKNQRRKPQENRVVLLAENTDRRVRDGANVKTNFIKSDNNSEAEAPDTSDQNASLANLASSALPKTTNAGINPLDRRSGDDAPGPADKAAPGLGLMRRASQRDVIVEPSFNSVSQASLNDVGGWNLIGNDTVCGQRNTNMKSLVETEEMLDKELEDAQEHRRRCEIEERNALRAYRNAQRALLESNVRCSDLYRKRELYAAHFRSLMLDNTSLLLSSRQPDPAEVGLGSFNSGSENAAEMIPSSSHQMPTELGLVQAEYGSNIPCFNCASCNIPCQHINGENIGSEPCSEPDASTSELLPHKGENDANGVCSPSIDLNTSADEDERMFPFDRDSAQPNFECKSRENNIGEAQNTLANEPKRQSVSGSSRDSLLLEATLRSQLFARLGTRPVSKDTDLLHNLDAAVDKRNGSDVNSEKGQMNDGSVPYSNAEKNQQSDHGDIDGPERSIAKAVAGTDSPSEESHLEASEIFSLPFILRGAFVHIKDMYLIGSMKLQLRNQQSPCGSCNEEGASVNSDEFQISNWMKNSAYRDISVRDIGSYTNSVAIDPHWPLCMFELRGRCNNDECPWQHLKESALGCKRGRQHDSSYSGEGLDGSVLHDATKRFKCDVLTPTYLVGLDTLKANQRSSESVLAMRNEECWKKCFSSFLALSSYFHRDLLSNEPLGNNGHIEVHGSTYRQLSHLSSRSGMQDEFKWAAVDNFQSLERALLILSQEIDKVEGVKKALSVLSRAIEANPACDVLWIIYLLIYYNNKSFDKDDMFHYAVKHNKGSYELWLMYINSREQLDERLSAYDAALSSLCQSSSASNGDDMNASACILDLFLQMMNCFCISGNVEKAIKRLCDLLPATTHSDEPQNSVLSDILSSFTIPDKCIFWTCCLYLVIYKKLPDSIVQHFECEKELLGIEWHSTHLADDEKQRALELVEIAVNSVEFGISCETPQSATNLRSLQHFALSHFKCMVAIKGLRFSMSLLEKYIKLYPTCLEFVLISARIRKHESGGLSFGGFEETVSNWPEGLPGIQCIWNQFVEYALRNKNLDFAKELMVRWYHTVWKVLFPQNDMDDVESSFSLNAARLSNSEPPVSSHDRIDVMFALLNLSLHKALQNDYSGARLATKRALKAAAPEYYKHCMKEVATFMVLDESLLKEEFCVAGVLDILNCHRNDSQASSVYLPLSRRFMNRIQKPRIRQLVANMFSPVSADFSLLDHVLEMLNGSLLVPKMFCRPKDLVDFVESIMEVLPSNYPLAISVCKLASGGIGSTSVTGAGLLYWARLLLVTSFSHAIPVPPEYAWVEAADVLCCVSGIDPISERFYSRALSVYPFSMKLWTSYYIRSKCKGDATAILQGARDRGIELDISIFGSS